MQPLNIGKELAAEWKSLAEAQGKKNISTPPADLVARLSKITDVYERVYYTASSYNKVMSNPLLKADSGLKAALLGLLPQEEKALKESLTSLEIESKDLASQKAAKKYITETLNAVKKGESQFNANTLVGLAGVASKTLNNSFYASKVIGRIYQMLVEKGFSAEAKKLLPSIPSESFRTYSLKQK